ncbi:hypothetical protein NQ318_012231 [Aromia moschata]|uniref:Uncharacterized protein n=1 Tax=Aromia moschata TaxID=1265417 RepID=A0AAV8YM76_9CUCU|nr:hypothetical protein NQ318_012231 [Aromia moschata]
MKPPALRQPLSQEIFGEYLILTSEPLTDRLDPAQSHVIHVLVRCAQLKNLLLLPKVCVKTHELQLVTENNNLINQSHFSEENIA